MKPSPKYWVVTGLGLIILDFILMFALRGLKYFCPLPASGCMINCIICGIMASGFLLITFGYTYYLIKNGKNMWKIVFVFALLLIILTIFLK